LSKPQYASTSVAKGKAATTNSFLLAGSTEEDKRFEQESIQVDEVPGDIHEQALQETTSTKEQR